MLVGPVVPRDRGSTLKGALVASGRGSVCAGVLLDGGTPPPEADALGGSAEAPPERFFRKIIVSREGRESAKTLAGARCGE